VLEDEDQQGLAHLLEHMAFNGSEHFDGNELIEVMQAMGMRFGAHVNAHTSFDETVYKLTVPTEPELLGKALLVFEDWAGGLTLSDEEIEKERGVVIEEWRRSLGPGRRISDQVVPLTYYGSPYHERLPIGTLESLQSFEPEAVRRFYEQWYRPDLMAFIAVGDFDVDEMEAQIKARFGKLENPDAPRERTRPPLPDHEPLYKIITDPELPQTSLSVLLKVDDIEGQTHGTYRETLIEGMVAGILNERFGAISRKPGAPYLGAGVSQSRLTPTEGSWGFGALAREGEILAAYEAGLVEIERMVRHGVTQAELDRARANTVRQFDAYLAEKENEDSNNAAGELIRVFTNDECMPGVEYEVDLVRAYLPAVTVAEVNAIAKARLTTGSKVVLVTLPEKDGVTPPTVEDLKAVEARVAAMDIGAPEAEQAVQPPIDAPAPGSISATDTSLVEPLGFTRWTLSNGIDVYWKKTDFKDDEVLFRGQSPGGLSLVPDADHVPASTAVSLAYRSGAGELDDDGLIRWTTGRKFNVGVSLGSDQEVLSGSASPQDLEAALTLLYARVVAPRFDADALVVEKGARAESLRNRLLNPSAVFRDAWGQALYPTDPLRRPWTLETLDQMDLARSEAIYKDRLADLHDADFVFVGALPDDFERLVTTWIATLPGGDRVEEPRDRGHRMATGPVSVTKHVGQDPKANVTLVWHGPFEAPSYLTRNRYNALDSVLSERLREELREEKSGVYGVSVGSRVERFPEDHYVFSISFTCDPERADELATEALRVVEELKAAPPAARYVEQVTAQRKRGYEEDLRQNSYWRGQLSGALDREEDPVDGVHGYLGRVESLTPADIQAAAKKYLSTKNFAKGLHLPEGAE
jgi:zinc protease